MSEAKSRNGLSAIQNPDYADALPGLRLLSLSRRSLDFFKHEAKKRRVPYQRMVRSLVDLYSERQGGTSGAR
jgi:hypothetical protein